MNENETGALEAIAKPKPKKRDEEPDFAYVIYIVLAIAAIWALVHFNPDEDAHMDAIRECITETVADNLLDGDISGMSLSSMRALSRLKYHSIGICSWTSTKYRGRPCIVSIGGLGGVFPLIIPQ